MADLYQRTCMKCDVHTDCYAYEDGFICIKCFDKEHLPDDPEDREVRFLLDGGWQSHGNAWIRRNSTMNKPVSKTTALRLENILQSMLEEEQ